MTDYNNRAEKRIDLDSARPVAFDGGTAVLCETYRPANNTEIATGEIPVAVSGVYSPTDLRKSLRAAGFDAEAISRAVEHQLTGPNATKAVSIAEKQAGQAAVL
jgi:SOS response regulatory protein OraA/RecX